MKKRMYTLVRREDIVRHFQLGGDVGSGSHGMEEVGLEQAVWGRGGPNPGNLILRTAGVGWVPPAPGLHDPM